MRPRSLTHLARLMCLSTVVLGLMLALVSPVWAATYRTHIARDPEIPYPTEIVRIWMNSDTVPGETAIVEYHIIGTGTYVMVLGTWDNTSYPGANWYADIPAFPAGTQVEYQLLTRNQFGSDYGFTGFNWNYTVRDLPQYVAQLPVIPIYTQSPRVWISSIITSTGEAGVILEQPGGPLTYAGTYSPTGYTGANWYVDLPAQSSGTLVAYHFYSEDQIGQYNENFTGRNYAVADLPGTVYVDDSWAGAVPGSDLGQPGVYNFGGNAFAIVQDGATGVAPGGTVNINAGAYTENVVITKSLTLAGVVPSDTIVIRPAVSDPNCGGAGGDALCAGGSNLILVQANNVTIHNLTLDGDNPALTSGIVRNGADLDARNGIIEDSASGVYGGLTVYDTTIRNIYLRGLSASSGGNNFNLHHNTVQNVQGDTAASAAIINEGGAGRIANNTISQAANAIAARNSRGTFIQYNMVTDSGWGVHTDNNGAAGGTYDVVEWNDVSNCTTGGHGVVVTAPWQDVSVHNNTISRCAHGLSVDAQSAVAWPTFTYNSIDGQSLANSIGIYATTHQLGWGTYDVRGIFDHNTIDNTTTGIYLEQSLITTSLSLTATHNTFSNNTLGLNMTGGWIFFFGNDVNTGSTALTQSGGFLAAYANNFVGYTTAVNRTAGSAVMPHNWWGTYTLQPAGVSNSDWQARLGRVSLGSAVGNGAVALGSASLIATDDISLIAIVSHGRDLGNAPFGNATLNYQNLCSAYYDFFAIFGNGTWSVSVPVDNTPECVAQTLNPGRIYWIPAGTDYSVQCTPYNNTACWDPITTNVITGGQNITVTGLSMADLGGTQFVAGSTTGTDPTAIAIVGFAAITDRSAAPAGIILAGAVIAATGLVLVARRRR